MIKYLYLTIFLSLPRLASATLEYKACDIKLPKYFYFNIESKVASIEDHLIEASTCTNSKNLLLTKSALGITGSIPIRYLEKIIGDKSINIISKSSNIKIDSIEDLIKRKISKVTGHNISKVKIESSPNFISSNQKILVDYDHIKQRVVLKENTESGSKEILNSNIDYSFEKTVFVSDETLYPYSNELKDGLNIFKKKYIIWKSKEKTYVPSNKNLDFYQLSRILNPSAPLMAKDISLKNVVFPGKPVPIILQKSGLIIKTIGISQSSGKLGDQVQVKLKNNKILTGKIKTGSGFYVKI